ncbi:MAG: hypothetical protein BMS9Abin07_2057 [Acidimicrobiia bacterium]|nr:MAG: hypothetical protein BMS9Abin07_2057 [Acidimicrobiia bacterium]
MRSEFPVPSSRFSGVRRWCLAVTAVVGFWALTAAPAVAQVIVPVEDLLADPSAFNGQTITVEGELIGDYGFRSDGTMWTQLNDDSYVQAPVVDGGELTGSNVGIGVRMPAALAQSLDPPGGYRVRGPVVQATGVWKYHDPDRQGESYLDASAVETVEQGTRLEESGNMVAIGIGVLLLAISGLLWLRYVAARDRT